MRVRSSCDWTEEEVFVKVRQCKDGSAACVASTVYSSRGRNITVKDDDHHEGGAAIRT